MPSKPISRIQFCRLIPPFRVDGHIYMYMYILHLMEGRCLSTTSRAWILSKGIVMCSPLNTRSNCSKSTQATALILTYIVQSSCTYIYTLVYVRCKVRIRTVPRILPCKPWIRATYMYVCATNPRIVSCVHEEDHQRRLFEEIRYMYMYTYIYCIYVLVKARKEVLYA